jgi:predicted patatin/cPLA2 family phospholipase
MIANSNPFKILCLDGGGSKGLYTLGVLSELEKELKTKLHEHFDLIFGTSTGAIIAAMVGLGYSISDIKLKYQQLIPRIMNESGQKKKSKTLNKLGKEIFGDLKFDAFQTGVGVVAMNYETQLPLIFKNNVDRAHGVKASFESGFGLSILDAVEASCAACPIFCKKELQTTNKGKITAIDGGFVANNPTLFALIDATKALDYDVQNIRILSIGVGVYIEKPLSKKFSFLGKLEMAQIASKVLVASSNTTEVVTKLLFPELSIERVNDAFPEPQFGTNMIEKNQKKLDKMYQLGIGSYAKHEKSILSVIK